MKSTASKKTNYVARDKTILNQFNYYDLRTFPTVGERIALYYPVSRYPASSTLWFYHLRVWCRRHVSPSHWYVVTRDQAVPQTFSGGAECWLRCEECDTVFTTIAPVSIRNSCYLLSPPPPPQSMKGFSKSIENEKIYQNVKSLLITVKRNECWFLF